MTVGVWKIVISRLGETVMKVYEYAVRERLGSKMLGGDD